MNGHPVCARCGGEIQPGQNVEIIAADDVAEARIILSEDALLVHADRDECSGLDE
jgi:hypothetical protein